MTNNLNGQVRQRNMNVTHLERIRSYVADHGLDAWIENGKVCVISNVMHITGQWSKVQDSVKTLAEARMLLGY